jgi:hypothetical protein
VCASNFEYDHELDLIVDVLRRMPEMPDRHAEGRVWYLWNQTTRRELREKWNKYPERAAAFFECTARSSPTSSPAARRVSTRCGGSLYTPALRRRTRQWITTERVDIARATNRLSVTSPPD